MQRLIGGVVDGGVLVPAEGFQDRLDEAFGLVGVEAALAFAELEQLACLLGEDVTAGENGGGPTPQLVVADQLQAQQRGEDAERIALERRFVDRAERGGMDRDTGLGEVVVADRLHAHQGEDPAQQRQLLGGTDTDGAVALDVETLEFAARGQRLLERRVCRQGLGVDVGDQLEQGAVLRHLVAVHVGHRLRKGGANLVGGYQGKRHDGMARCAKDEFRLPSFAIMGGLTRACGRVGPNR